MKSENITLSKISQAETEVRLPEAWGRWEWGVTAISWMRVSVWDDKVPKMDSGTMHNTAPTTTKHLKVVKMTNFTYILPQ